MTRQNVTDGPREILTRKCPTCAGEGVVVSEATAVVDAERKLRALAASKPRTKAFKVELNDHVAGLLVGPGAARLEEIEAQAKRRFFVVGKAGVGHDHFAVIDEGTVEKLAVAGAPVTEGQTLEVKPVEVGRFDVGAGMAKLDGDYLICVAGAAKLVGKKVNVRIARVLDGTAYAVLADAAPAATSVPITAEAQAEKPTRASRAKKPEAAAEPEVTEGELVAEEEEPEPVAEEAEEGLVAEEAEAEEPSAGTPPKPKTRRGSRGGRGRKKKPAATEVSVTPTEVPEPEAEAPDTPDEAAADEAPKKKKTRRGSRGGRGRKKPATAAAETNGASEPEPKPAPEPAPAAPRRPTIHVPEAEAPSTNGDEPGAAPARKRTRRGSRGGRRHRKPTTAAAEQQPSDES
jgi:ribonuclease G